MKVSISMTNLSPYLICICRQINLRNQIYLSVFLYMDLLWYIISIVYGKKKVYDGEDYKYKAC